MSFYHNPRVITDQLVFYIDAGNVKSYPKTGDTVYDLSGNNNHPTTISSSMSWDSGFGGQFVFDGTGLSSMLIPTALPSASPGISIEVWFWRNTNVTNTYIWDARAGGGTYLFTNWGANINWGNVALYNNPEAYTANSPMWGNWHHFTAVSELGVGTTVYIDGLNEYFVEGVADRDLGTGFRIGSRYTNGTYWRGFMSLFKIYTKALTASEVKTNYIATKGRFGK